MLPITPTVRRATVARVTIRQRDDAGRPLGNRRNTRAISSKLKGNR